MEEPEITGSDDDDSGDAGGGGDPQRSRKRAKATGASEAAGSSSDHANLPPRTEAKRKKPTKAKSKAPAADDDTFDPEKKKKLAPFTSCMLSPSWQKVTMVFMSAGLNREVNSGSPRDASEASELDILVKAATRLLRFALVELIVAPRGTEAPQAAPRSSPSITEASSRTCAA
mmetsp:Transcript_27040/g.72578  ORF Transcript_27040/g.72578 Transcript_27040/m.72578 type:complete len:173 (-) Transcript_27040:107-625(-)